MAFPGMQCFSFYAVLLSFPIWGLGQDVVSDCFNLRSLPPKSSIPMFNYCLLLYSSCKSELNSLVDFCGKYNKVFTKGAARLRVST